MIEMNLKKKPTVVCFLIKYCKFAVEVAELMLVWLKMWNQSVHWHVGYVVSSCIYKQH